MELKDRIALITGAGSGMGRASALAMAREGATIVVADYNLESATRVAKQIADEKIGKGVPYEVDMSDVAQIRAMMDFVQNEFGRLEILYNHVGAPGPGGLTATEEEWTRTIDLNIKSAFFATSFAEKLLRASPGKASVMFTSSVSGIVGSGMSPIYSLCKGGIVTFAKSLALWLAPDVRVNAICPGGVDTPMLPLFYGRDPGADPSARIKAYLETAVPLRRLCQPEEVANVAVFLASDRSSYITGSAIAVDGGFLAR
ncbi:MAG TPA: SDR family oxidoreductase [Rhodoblastus sp.]|nr:SDR family oxidoreductase [Rhodoblastus sp.]